MHLSRLATFGAGILLMSAAAGQQATAAPVTVQDNYWGGIGTPGGTIDTATTNAYGDVIGDASAFNIMSATVSRAGNNLTITINTNYNAADFNITQFGDLFITEGSNYQPNGTAATNYRTDDLTTTGTTWQYAIQATGLNADAAPNQGVVPPLSGAATAYALGLNNGGIITSNITAGTCSQQQYGYPSTAGCNYIWRYDQPVEVATQDYTAANSPDGVAVTGATLDGAGDGLWSFVTDPTSGYDLSYTFDAAALDPNLLVGTDGFNIAFSWAMTCANDIIQGDVSVPEPTSIVLFGTALFGIGLLRRGARVRPSRV
jgi:hypothetical protein